jgi:predicted dithiol-disulfide oxidoreductase (DUF899 family)
MADHFGARFAGESDDYRHARLELLRAERRLRREVENVAALRRALPDGHDVATDYEFDEIDPGTGTRKSTRLSELFELPERSLIVYSFMYPEGAPPCPMCTAFLDSFNATAPHAKTQVNLAVVAKGPIEAVSAWANERGWSNLRMLSSASNSFNRDYLSETSSGDQIPLVTVFRQKQDRVRHFYTSELFFTSSEPGQHPRHMDMVFPLWNVFDLAGEGRPENWFPQLSY